MINWRHVPMILRHCCWIRNCRIGIKTLIDSVSIHLNLYLTATGIVVEMTNGKWDNVGIGTRQTGLLPSVEKSAFVQLILQTKYYFLLSLAIDCSVLWKGGRLPIRDNWIPLSVFHILLRLIMIPWFENVVCQELLSSRRIRQCN